MTVYHDNNSLINDNFTSFIHSFRSDGHWVTSLFWMLLDTHWPITIMCPSSLNIRINSISQSDPWGPNNQSESIKTQSQYFDAWRVTQSAVIIYRKIYKAEKLQSFVSCAPVCSTNTELALKFVFLPSDGATRTFIWWGNPVCVDGGLGSGLKCQGEGLEATDGSQQRVKPACLCADEMALFIPRFLFILRSSSQSGIKTKVADVSLSSLLGNKNRAKSPRCRCSRLALVMPSLCSSRQGYRVLGGVLPIRESAVNFDD